MHRSSSVPTMDSALRRSRVSLLAVVEGPSPAIRGHAGMVAFDLVVFAGHELALAPASDADTCDQRMESGLLDVNECGEGSLGTLESVPRFDGRRWPGVHLQD